MPKRILFADNDQKFLQSRKEFLEQEGYQVVPAANETEARRILEQGTIDLAILDIRLREDKDNKDISGLTLAKETDPAIPKIILTNYPTYEAVREALGVSMEGLPAAVGFVAKYEGPEALLRAVRKALQVMSRWFRTTQDEITEQLNEDYKRAREEARIHYWVSLAISLVFAIPIIMGSLLAHEGSVAIGLAIAIGGLVIEILNYLFSSRLDIAHGRVDKFHDELLQTKRLENLLAACDVLVDADNKERCIMQVIQRTANSWAGSRNPNGPSSGLKFLGNTMDSKRTDAGEGDFG